MVLQVLYTAATTVLPFNYWPHAAVAVAVLLVIYAYAQGRSTIRERDLHARVIILTVSPLIDIVIEKGLQLAWGGGGFYTASASRLPICSESSLPITPMVVIYPLVVSLTIFARGHSRL